MISYHTVYIFLFQELFSCLPLTEDGWDEIYVQKLFWKNKEYIDLYYSSKGVS